MAISTKMAQIQVTKNPIRMCKNSFWQAVSKTGEFWRPKSVITWICAILVEIAIIIVSWKGTILEDELRWHSEYLLYIKLVVWICEIGYTIFCAIWLKNHYNACQDISTYHQNIILGKIFKSHLSRLKINFFRTVYDRFGDWQWNSVRECPHDHLVLIRYRRPLLGQIEKIPEEFT